MFGRRRRRESGRVEPTGLLLLIALAAVAVGCAAVGVVPAGHRAVVVRAGRPVRSRAPGVLLRAPGIERVVMVPLHPPPIDALSVNAQTRDGVEVRLAISLLWRVTAPEQAACATPDLWSATASAADWAVRHVVLDVQLTALLHDRAGVLRRVTTATRPLTDPIGVEVIDVDLLHAEVRLGPELLRLLT